ncbi:hypothetical protein G7085_13910 [Tessaracoccus sp. HDW20]|nr:hypothetical protein [Tessaracoccus coleopterorum]NHB85344.1 hypothetical protein [Tessaracoccus coleopterorum]
MLLPLSAVTLTVMAFSNRWRRRLALPSFLILAVGTLGAGAATLSGDELAARVGQPGAHGTLGTALAFVAFAYLLGTGAWLLWTRVSTGSLRDSGSPGSASRPCRWW